MKQSLKHLNVATRGKGLYNCTGAIASWLRSTGISTGVLTVFIQHTSASLAIQENADPDVVADLKSFFERLVPEDARLYLHQDEGDDDMPAHIRAALTQTSLSIPLAAGRLALGTWQGIYLFEHRSASHRRSVFATLIGE